MRIDGWEARLCETVESHAKAAFAWGQSDCFTLPMDVAKAMTGTDPWAEARSYKTEQGAARALSKHGFKSLADAFAAKFEEIPPAFADRGDIGIAECDGKMCGVVIVGHELAGKTEGGIVFFSRQMLRRAFRVE